MRTKESHEAELNKLRAKLHKWLIAHYGDEQERSQGHIEQSC